MLYEEPRVEIIEFDGQTFTEDITHGSTGTGNDFDFGEQFPM